MKRFRAMSEKSLTKYFFSGGFGGVCTVFAGHPMDTIKVRLQTMPVPKKGETPLYCGTWDCFMKTVRNEGFRGLYKGMSAPLVGVAPVFAISFFSFGLGKKLINSDEKYLLSKVELFAAGAFSGVFTSFVMAPADRVKSLMQIQSMGKVPIIYKSSFDCAKQLYMRGGIRNIYKGTIATMLRDVPASGMFFMTYEVLKDLLVDGAGSVARETLATIFAGGLAGMANWVVAIPADVLKSRLQTAPEGKYPRGLRDVFKELMLHEGPTALYKRLTPIMLRSFPANAACFLSYEIAANFISWIAPNI